MQRITRTECIWGLKLLLNGFHLVVVIDKATWVDELSMAPRHGLISEAALHSL